MERTLPKFGFRKDIGIKVGAFSAIGNILLFACKYLASSLCGNAAILAEGFDNLMDSVNALMVLLGFQLSDKEKDMRHPYGHGRAEYVLGLVIAITIILTGVTMLGKSVSWILHPPVRAFPVMVYAVSGLSIAVKYGLVVYTKHVNKCIDSQALAACEQNNSADIKMTALTIVSSLLYPVVHFPVDGIAGVIISALILKDGIKTFTNHFMLLLGESLPEQQALKIQSIFESRKNFVSLKKIDFHDYGPENKIILLQIVVNQGSSPEEVKQCIDGISEELEQIGLCVSISLSMDQYLGLKSNDNTEKLVNTWKN